MKPASAATKEMHKVVGTYAMQWASGWLSQMFIPKKDMLARQIILFASELQLCGTNEVERGVFSISAAIMVTSM